MIERSLPEVLLALFVWLWRNVILPSLPILPPELPDAAKAVSGAARKWEAVADVVLSWNLPVAFAVGALAMLFLVSLRRTSP